MTAHPTAVWQILEKPRARDGDSVYLVRERELARDEEMVVIRRDPKPVLCRVLWLACPEISGPKKDPVNGPRATRDAQDWFDGWWTEGGLIAVQYGYEKYGRPLVDIRPTGVDESFSQWMVGPEANDGKGWDVYVE